MSLPAAVNLGVLYLLDCQWHCYQQIAPPRFCAAYTPHSSVGEVAATARVNPSHSPTSNIPKTFGKVVLSLIVPLPLHVLLHNSVRQLVTIPPPCTGCARPIVSLGPEMAGNVLDEFWDFQHTVMMRGKYMWYYWISLRVWTVLWTNWQIFVNVDRANMQLNYTIFCMVRVSIIISLNLKLGFTWWHSVTTMRHNT